MHDTYSETSTFYELMFKKAYITVVISLEGTKYTVSEGDTTILRVNVLEGAIVQSVVVQLSTHDGTASSES